MKRSFVIASLIAIACVGFGAQNQSQKKPDKSTHHAAMHAENWVRHHTSAPHRSKAASRRIARKNNQTIHTVHHAAMHAEHWVDHHVSAPHKKKPIHPPR